MPTFTLDNTGQSTNDSPLRSRQGVTQGTTRIGLIANLSSSIVRVEFGNDDSAGLNVTMRNITEHGDFEERLLDLSASPYVNIPAHDFIVLDMENTDLSNTRYLNIANNGIRTPHRTGAHVGDRVLFTITV